MNHGWALVIYLVLGPLADEVICSNQFLAVIQGVGEIAATVRLWLVFDVLLVS